VAARLQITSASNGRLVALRRLRRRGGRLVLVEGFRPLGRAVEAGARVRELYVAPDLFLGDGEPELARALERRGADVVELGAAAFRSIAGRPRPDGLLALLEPPTTELGALELGPAPLLLVAEGIERPGNLGTIARTACGARASALVVCDAATRLLHPDTVQGSVGAVFRVPLAESSSLEARAWLRTRGVRTIVASPEAERPFWEADYRGAVAIVVGSERNGVSPLWRESSERVAIPMSAGVDSLNVAVAAGIVLFEAARQRSAPTASTVSSASERRTTSASASASAAGG
jgi:TrmH family RNA methyltransferase